MLSQSSQLSDVKVEVTDLINLVPNYARSDGGTSESRISRTRASGYRPEPSLYTTSWSGIGLGLHI